MITAYPKHSAYIIIANNVRCLNGVTGACDIDWGSRHAEP